MHNAAVSLVDCPLVGIVAKQCVATWYRGLASANATLSQMGSWTLALETPMNRGTQAEIIKCKHNWPSKQRLYSKFLATGLSCAVDIFTLQILPNLLSQYQDKVSTNVSQTGTFTDCWIRTFRSCTSFVVWL